MKPTSVIFLIVSVILACVGVLLCLTATNMANAQGVAIFSNVGDSQNNYTITQEFNSSEVKKIVINVTNVDINVIGGVTDAKIELVNFTEGTYDYSLSKSTIQLKDTTAITNIIDIDNFKINFNGFRDYLNFFKYKDKQRSINLYLPDDAAVIILNITTDGNLVLDNLRCNCDYKCFVSNGNVTVNDVRTDSSLSIDSTGDSSISITSLYANDLSIDGNTAYANIGTTDIVRSMYIKIKSGAVEYDRMEDNFAGFNVLLRADSGVVKCFDTKTINGIYEEHNYIEPTEPEDTEPSDTEIEAESEETQSSSSVADAFSITIIVNEGNITVY